MKIGTSIAIFRIIVGKMRKDNMDDLLTAITKLKNSHVRNLVKTRIRAVSYTHLTLPTTERV